MRLLLLASYCQDEELHPDCTEDFPCHECLQMCNVVNVPDDTKLEVLGGLCYLKEEAEE